MKKLSIFIDNNTEDKDDKDFALKLKKRLKGIKEDFDIILYADIEKNDGNEDDEDKAINTINNSEIIIPILSSNYLSYVNKKFETVLNDVIESDDKYLFPILLKPISWSSYKWVVKSKLIPSDEKPILEHTDNEIDVILNDLVRTINNIITNYYSPPSNNTTKNKKTPISNGNILFISHDHEDADFAELLKLKLEKNGLRGWIDSERLKIGQDWREEIDQAIENSMAVIAVMTPDARKSEYVTYEWAFAWGKGVKIFPIMLKQTQLHPRLESLQYLDFTNRATRPWEKLINSIEDLTKELCKENSA